MSDIGKFWALLNLLNEAETKKKEAEAVLKENYLEFIKLCPHSEALDWRYGGSGIFRVCMICGVEDRASQGGTSGDEYNYGYPGHPNKEFWAGSNVKTADSEAHHWEWRYKHSHSYRVSGGKVE